MRVSASLLSSDLLNLEREIKTLETAGVDAVHIDIMDGHFVPNIAFGIDIVKFIGKVSSLPITVHLMVEHPEQFVDVISYSNVDYLIVHSEGNRNIEETLESIKDKGISAGLALNPQTPVSSVRRFFDLADMFLVMGVYPGFGGQALIPSTVEKIRQIKSIKNDAIVGIDGGINESSVSFVNKEKPDILVVGSYLFDSDRDDRLAGIKEKLKVLCKTEE